jgi:hypothetical protein
VGAIVSLPLLSLFSTKGPFLDGFYLLILCHSSIRDSGSGILTTIVSSSSESWHSSLLGGASFAAGFAVGFAPGKSIIGGTAGRRVFEGMISFLSM